MQPDEGRTRAQGVRRLPGAARRAVPLRRLGRLGFYATGREADLAVCVATGDNRLYANILLTVGYVAPSS
jgi:L-fucose mutarotase